MPHKHHFFNLFYGRVPYLLMAPIHIERKYSLFLSRIAVVIALQTDAHWLGPLCGGCGPRRNVLIDNMIYLNGNKYSVYSVVTPPTARNHKLRPVDERRTTSGFDKELLLRRNRCSNITGANNGNSLASVTNIRHTRSPSRRQSNM